MNTDKIKKFYTDLQAVNHSKKCPFLIEWFNSKVRELDGLVNDVDRSGIAKGDRMPVPKGKMVLALHHITFAKLPLKKYCDLIGLVYGTARNWKNTDPIFQEVVAELAAELSDAFIRRYAELVEKHDPQSFSQAVQLIKECRYYQNAAQVMIIVGLKQYGSHKLTAADEPPGLDFLDIVKTHRLLFHTLLLSLENNDTKRRKYAQSLMDAEAEAFDRFFTKLRENYKNREALAAIELAEMRANESIIYYTTIMKEFIG